MRHSEVGAFSPAVRPERMPDRGSGRADTRSSRFTASSWDVRGGPACLPLLVRSSVRMIRFWSVTHRPRLKGDQLDPP